MGDERTPERDEQKPERDPEAEARPDDRDAESEDAPELEPAPSTDEAAFGDEDETRAERPSARRKDR